MSVILYTCKRCRWRGPASGFESFMGSTGICCDCADEATDKPTEMTRRDYYDEKVDQSKES